MTDQRITFDGDMNHLDEVVMDGTVHIEALDAHTYMIIVWNGTRRLHLHGLNLTYFDDEGCNDLIEIGPPLTYCGHEWQYGIKHNCTLNPGHAGKHQCDCQDKGRRNNDGTKR